METQRESLTNSKKIADQKSLQLKVNDGKIREMKLKLNTASSNREFDIIKSQIDADTMANSVLEDEILEALEKVNQTQIDLGKATEELAAAQAEEQRVADEFLKNEANLRRRVTELEATIRDAERGLPGEVSIVYRRLVQAHGAGALASVENNACTSCNVVMSPQSRVELNSGKIIFCRTCGRLLYLADTT